MVEFEDKVDAAKRLDDDTEVYRFRNVAIPLDRYFDKLYQKGLNERGDLIPDPTPMEPPLGFVEGPDLFEQMRQLIRRELSAAAAGDGHESFEEADDFDVDDDPELVSEYELDDRPPPGGTWERPPPAEPAEEPAAEAAGSPASPATEAGGEAPVAKPAAKK